MGRKIMYESKAFIESIPVYPKEATMKEIARSAEIDIRKAQRFYYIMGTQDLVCESDSGGISFLTQEAKAKSIWKRNINSKEER